MEPQVSIEVWNVNLFNFLKLHELPKDLLGHFCSGYFPTLSHRQEFYIAPLCWTGLKNKSAHHKYIIGPYLAVVVFNHGYVSYRYLIMTVSILSLYMPTSQYDYHITGRLYIPCIFLWNTRPEYYAVMSSAIPMQSHKYSFWQLGLAANRSGTTMTLASFWCNLMC